ncbi:MAG: hypothetical protein FJX47_21415, partial [Alphaproteobacteria bacterium]|nr:hypothetical protein [Alphaproteobacteria bacterium]
MAGHDKSFFTISVKQRIALVALLPLLAYLVLGAGDMMDRREQASRMARLESDVRVAAVGAALVDALQRERGMSATFIGSRGQQMANELAAQRQQTDDRHTAFKAAVVAAALPAGSAMAEGAGAVERMIATIGANRQGVSGLQLRASDSFAFYTGVVQRLAEVNEEIARAVGDPGLRARLDAYIALGQVKEFAGQERATGAQGLAAGTFENAAYGRFLPLAANQAIALRQVLGNSSPETRAAYAQAVTADLVAPVEQFRKRIAEAGPDRALNLEPGAAGAWFAAATRRMDAIKAFEDRLGAALIEQARGLGREAGNQFMVLAAIMTGVLVLVGALVWVIVLGITRPM